MAVGKRADLEARYEAKTVRNCQHKLVMPGFVNSHLHFYHTMHRGLAPEGLGGWLWSNYVHQGRNPAHARGRNHRRAHRADGDAALGTTTFLEAGSYNPQAVIEGLSMIGLRGLMGRRSFDQAILNHAMLMEDTEICLKENLKFLKQFRDGYNGGLIKACVDIVGMGRVTDRLYVESKKMADDHGTTLNFHLAAMWEELLDTRMKTGHRPVEHLYKLGVLGPNVVMVHMIQVTDREIRMLKDANANVIHCPSTALKLNYELSAKGRFPEMMEHGVNVAIGSDASDCSNYADMIRTMYLAAVLPKDYRNDADISSAEQAIEMATVNGARAIGMQKEIGSLEPGKKADVIIINMRNPAWYPNFSEVQNLVYSASGDAVETVYVNGRLVMENRKILTVDEEKILDRCAELGEAILKRGNLKVPGKWPIF